MTRPTWPTIKEAAARLGVSVQYVHRLVQQGRLHGQMRGDVWLLDPENLRQFEAERKRKQETAKKQANRG